MSNPLDFRAPPPSPVGPGRRSSVANDDVLTDFLNQTLIVPDLVLPDRVFPRQNPKIQSLPKLDFKKHNFSDDFKLEEVLIEVIAQKGCFELVNHGISNKLLWDVKECGKGVFALEDEKKRGVLRTNERLYGFVDVCGDDKDASEEFVWCRDESSRSEMEGVWPNYTDFSEKMEDLMSKIENISESLLKLFLDPSTPKSRFHDDSTRDKETMGSMCYLYKHCKNTDNLSNDDEYMDSLSYDVIRMLIRGSEQKHALCFHVCDGSSEFHVYSKKGWVSFSPDKHALVVTIGDQLQTWSEGKYKHVIGRPIFKGELEDCISMAFLYSPNLPISKGQKDNTISLAISNLGLDIYYSMSARTIVLV
ncbi:1-aminocyclopropane-1-carboxylate oxidase 5-like protein [Tanacetum coccineum]